MTDTPILRFDAKSQGVQLDLGRLMTSRLLVQSNSGGGMVEATDALFLSRT